MRPWPRWPMWRTGLLLSFLCSCACREEDCVLGIVGQPVSLPCLYPELTTSKNFSIEWRRDGEVVLRSVWEGDRNAEEWSVDNATVSADALTGNLSLELPTVDPKEHNMDYSLYIKSGENQSALLCRVCLRVAASFSSPLLQRKEAQGKTAYICHSGGGFPEPTVYWLINDTEEPPEGAVKTLTAIQPDSYLNVTSHLTVNNSNISSVSCIIENRFINETLTSTSYAVQGTRKEERATEALWIFSTALCVVVGVMVMAAVAYQIHLDRTSKKKKKEYQNQNRGYKRRCPNEVETESMKIEPETDV
ncbi:ICOS ligand-like [Anabas testudineus]|uniref:ICOS ligand-like n=1 Tax=Anabas testudineus TaxID=64144 RepID=UPI000E45F6C9|nr:ICOS ligand-like [Anabas testudineus]